MQRRTQSIPREDVDGRHKADHDGSGCHAGAGRLSRHDTVPPEFVRASRDFERMLATLPPQAREFWAVGS